MSIPDQGEEPAVESEPSEVPEWTFGDRLRKARRHAGLTNEQMAQRFNVTSGTISNWENDLSKVRIGQLPMATKWAKITRVSLNWLLTGDPKSRCPVGLGPLVVELLPPVDVRQPVQPPLPGIVPSHLAAVAS